jgi:hypothetical protein
MRPRARPTLTWLALATFLVPAAACSDDDDDNGPSETPGTLFDETIVGDPTPTTTP